MYGNTRKRSLKFPTLPLRIPFTNYEKSLNLEEFHGIDIGASYRNDKACAEFVDYPGEVLNEKLAKDLMKANFYSILSDGSTDCTVREQVCTFVLYFDPGRVFALGVQFANQYPIIFVLISIQITGCHSNETRVVYS